MDDCLVWEIEHIPNEAATFMRAHRDHIRNGDLQPGVFQVRNGGMSVDWDKYSSPQDTRQRGREPLANAVISLSVLKIRAIEDLDVKHSPILPPESPNRSHSNVTGIPESRIKLTKTRVLLLDISNVVIPL